MVIRQDGLEKVMGTAKYSADFTFPNMLYGVMVRIPAAHAKIISTDYSTLLDHPFVTAVCNHTDITGEKNTGPIKKDQPIFCYDKIVTPGDVVAMIIGGSEKELISVRHLAKIEYSSLPLLTDPELALQSDAILIHPELSTNEIIHYPLRKGDIEKGFEQSDYILSQTYTTQFVEHAYIEPECVIALPIEGNKGVQIIGSIQNPFTARKVVASVLNWPLTKVKVLQAELGGSFGGKDDTMNILAARAAVASVKTGRPVKIKYSREDSILESYKRHPYRMNYKIGYNGDGRIKAMFINILADGGAYSSMSPFVTWRTVVQATGPYEIENVWTDVRAVYTNNPYTGAMRGFGSPQPVFAQESIMDEIAIHLGITPYEIRRINGFRQGSYTASGQKLEGHDVNLIKVMDRAVEKTEFSQKWKQNMSKENNWITTKDTSSSSTESNKYKERFKIILNLNDDSPVISDHELIEPDHLIKKGIGLALSYRGCSLGAEGIDAAAAYLSVQQDGSLYLLSGLAENGQGLRTTLCIIAAEIFGIDTENIYYLPLDTANVPDSGPTVASRSTLMGGGAVKQACETILHRFRKLLQNEWKLNETEKIIFSEGYVYTENVNRRMSFKELCGVSYSKGVSLSTIGWYKGPNVHWDEATGQGAAYFTYVYGCQIAEVSVNMGTGEVYIDKITAVHDPGKVINRSGAEGQVYGGVTQGAGYALWEEISAHAGRIRELNFDQYLIPTSKDIGEIDAEFIEGKDEFGAGGKSLGEPTLELTAAAIANAIRNATGKRYFNLPINLEELLLEKKLYPESQRGSL